MNLLKSIFILLLLSIAYLSSPNSVHANMSLYRSAGWVGTENNAKPYIDISGCQTSDDGLYCSRPVGTGNTDLFFGSFGNLEDFGIPLNSTINTLRFRVKGNSTTTQYVGLKTGYNSTVWTSICQSPSTLWPFNLGSNNSTFEKQTFISGNGLSNCITQNHINFRNLTFRISSGTNSSWAANIDNFEIGFDYTPPATTPTPTVFPENQTGVIWEVGPDKTTFKQLEGINNVLEVTTGQSFGAALKNDGTVWTWTNLDKETKQLKGENGVGFLSNVKKIAAGGNNGMALKDDGSVWEWAMVSDEPQNPTRTNLSNIVDIATGRLHKLALKADGKVYGWGLNNDGQVGIGCFLFNCSFVNSPTQTHNIDNVKAISAGWGHSLALKNDGTVWGWGESSSLQLGEKIQQNGSIGFSERPLPTQITELNNIKSISSKEFYNMVINSTGEIMEWGNFTIGIPRIIEGMLSASSVSVGTASFSSGVTGHAIKEDGTLWQLYINDIPPKQVPHLKDVIAVASGDQSPALAVINSTGEVLGDSTYAGAFLDLPYDYIGQNREFEQAVYNPESWFDHKYPLQNVSCCEFKVRKYTGGDDVVDAYRSHSGYDYASANGVVLGTSVLAAASGSAELVLAKNSGGAGNVIKIDHGNGYQTWYEHLSSNDLVIGDEDSKVVVAKGQSIGKVGMTGIANGPHIHFSVFKDANENGNFNDDYPFGLVDPLGWDGDTKDPWTEYQKDNRFGAESVKLFTNLLKPVQKVISKTGGEVVSKNLKVKIPADSLPLDFTIKVKDGPFEDIEQDNKTLNSIVPSFFLEAYTSLNEKITHFLNKIIITYDYSEADLSNIKEETLKMYYFDTQEKKWIAVDSIVDLDKKIIIAEIDHFTQFAVMGEPKDTTAPSTDITINGEEGEDNFFRSSANIELKGIDDENGLGIQYELYSLNDSEWLEYKVPIIVENEGSYKLSYQSFDKAGNKEVRKSAEFEIDKTDPTTNADISGIEGLAGWYRSNVNLSLNSSDEGSGIFKTEYSVDDGESYKVYDNELTISTEGVSKLLYRSIDKAGNIEESKKLDIKIDKMPPSTLVYTTGTEGQEGWYRTNVTVAFNANDEWFGYHTTFYSINDGEFLEYLTPLILDSDGKHQINYYSMDKAGNKEEQKLREYNIDKTSPTISVNVIPNVIWPPNGNMVEIKVDGNITEDNLYRKSFNITDEYNRVEPVLSGIGQIIKLEAKRNGNDEDGRLYLIKAVLEDLAGNISNAEAKVIVPHEQN